MPPQQSLGIPVRVDLPVGNNMQSHFGHPEPAFLVHPSSPAATSPLLNAFNPMTYWRYLISGSGPLRTAGGLEAMGFYRTGLNNESRPDVQILFVSAHYGTDGGVSAARNLNVNEEQVQ